MCNPACIKFGEDNLFHYEIFNKKVIGVESLYADKTWCDIQGE